MSLAPTAPRPAILNSLPRYVTDYTPEQRQACVEYIATLPTATIRKRQGVIASQMRSPLAIGKVFEGLQEMYDLETDAIHLRELGIKT